MTISESRIALVINGDIGLNNPVSTNCETVILELADGAKMSAYTARPAGPGLFPGLILFQEAFGVNEHIRDVARRFAAEGYHVIAPELFHRTASPGFVCAYADFGSVRPHLSAVTEAGLEQDTLAAWSWLQAQTTVKPGAMACIGYCLGGRAAFLANSVRPFKAAVSYYGGSIAPAMLPRAAAQCGPVLMFWGGLDKHIPPEQAAQVVLALRAAGKSYLNVEVSYADHGFFCDERPSFSPAAAREAWALTLAFLREKLAAD